MNKIRKHLKEKPKRVLPVTVVLGALTFLTNLVSALKDGNIDLTEYRQLIDNSKAFETVALFLIMIAFTNKKK